MSDDRKTVTIRLRGGLGNQMFQFAFGTAMAGNRRLLFDTSELDSDSARTLALDCFDLDLELGRFSPIARGLAAIPGMWRWMGLLGRSLRLPDGRLVWDAMNGFDRRWLELGGTVYAVGYWQSEKYFRSIGDRIREIFTFSDVVTEETASLLSKCTNAIGVQVRRGDYVDPSVAMVHPPPPVDYFKRAVDLLVEKHGIQRVIVTTDDPAWARQNLAFSGREMIVRSQDSAPPWEDMMVLSRCGHAVISNSSFGWWSAWLGRSDRSIVCPKQWYGDRATAFKSPAMSSWSKL